MFDCWWRWITILPSALSSTNGTRWTTNDSRQSASQQIDYNEKPRTIRCHVRVASLRMRKFRTVDALTPNQTSISSDYGISDRAHHQQRRLGRDTWHTRLNHGEDPTRRRESPRHARPAN